MYHAMYSLQVISKHLARSHSARKPLWSNSNSRNGSTSDRGRRSTRATLVRALKNPTQLRRRRSDDEADNLVKPLVRCKKIECKTRFVCPISLFSRFFCRYVTKNKVEIDSKKNLAPAFTWYFS